MISSRNNHLVIGKRAVLVRDVVDSVCARNSVDFITRRFPVNLQEIWECIDAIADIDRLGRGVHLKVNNSSNDRQNINLETIQISDIFFIKTVQYGKVFLPDSNNFNTLFDTGFIKLATEVYGDLVEGSNTFEESDLHVVIYKAIDNAIGDTLSNEEMYRLLKEQDEKTT
tara:strand:+ start:1988 stop:2497 length:510 start_codon:yes stop_codon:yes gene_type:complete